MHGNIGLFIKDVMITHGRKVGDRAKKDLLVASGVFNRIFVENDYYVIDAFMTKNHVLVTLAYVYNNDVVTGEYEWCVSRSGASA